MACKKTYLVCQRQIFHQFITHNISRSIQNFCLFQVKDGKNYLGAAEEERREEREMAMFVWRDCDDHHRFMTLMLRVS